MATTLRNNSLHSPVLYTYNVKLLYGLNYADVDICVLVVYADVDIGMFADIDIGADVDIDVGL